MLGVVQAGGRGSRMDVLTRERAKPALPFAGTYRLVDFALSSFLHSGITDVWVDVQYQAGTLDQHLAGGRPWDLDRTRGGYRRVVPDEGDGPDSEAGFASGNADSLLRLLDEVEAFAPDVLVVTSADHVHACDLRRVVQAHLDTGAECTVVTSEVSRTEARHHATVQSGGDGRVTAFEDKPARPGTGTVATEIFVHDPRVLFELLTQLRAELSADPDHDTGVGDFGDHLVPRLVDRGATFAYPMAGYWMDVGRPESYLSAHRDLLAGRVDVFDVAHRPVLSRPPELLPARVRRGAVVEDSMLSPGCDVRGEVVRSVLGPGVRVARGARVEDCVIGSGVVVEGGARVSTSIVDDAVVVGQRATVGRLSSRRRTPDAEITIVGRDSRIGRRCELGAGARLEPGTTA